MRELNYFKELYAPLHDATGKAILLSKEESNRNDGRALFCRIYDTASALLYPRLSRKTPYRARASFRDLLKHIPLNVFVPVLDFGIC